MIWWIVLGLVILGLLLLVLAVLPVFRRLPGLRRAMMKTRQRAVDAEALRPALDALQVRLAEVSAHVDGMAQRVPQVRDSGSGQAR